jgi:uncharacterized protein YoxC
MVVQIKPELDREQTEVVEEPTSGIDLNQANQKTLTQLPGIGPTLASRIIAHRESEGPFLLKEDLMDVPGIATTLYAQVEDQLIVTVPTATSLAAQETEKVEDADAVPAAAVTPPPLPVEATTGEPLENTAPDIEVAEITTIAPQAYEPPPGIEHAPPPEETELDLPLDEDNGEKTEPTAAVQTTDIPTDTPEDTTPTAANRQERTMPWLWPTLIGALLGGLLGVFFSILVFAGINGSIDIGQSRAVQDLRGEVSGITVELDAVRSDVSALQGDVRGIRERVEVLSGLTARMEEAESAVETLSSETAGLKEDTRALQSAVEKLGFDINAMAETLETVEAQTEKSMTFFERLSTLLQEIFEETEPQGRAPTHEEVDG